jgi:uncharacterized protein (DUF2062 family)
MKNAPRSRKSWWRHLYHAMVRMLRGAVLLEDTPERIARGCACGMYAAVLPVFGQTFIGMILARLLRGNVISSIPWSWISNPLTTVPIWYGCYRVGVALLPGHQAVGWHKVQAIAEEMSEAPWREALLHGWDVLGDIAVPLVLGTNLVGLVFGLLGYAAVRRVVPVLQARRRARLAHWHRTNEV